MKDLFQELYNKVLSLFNSSKEENDPTKNLAVNRLKTVLMQDRAGFSERAIQMLKEELTQVVSKYMEINAEDFEMLIDTNDEGKTLLNLSITVLKAKTDEEIDEWVKEQELKIQKKAQEIAKELEGTIKEKAKTLIDNGEENSDENIKTETETAENKEENKEEENTETEDNSDKEDNSLPEINTENACEQKKDDIENQAELNS